MEKSYQLGKIQRVNPEVYAWIKVPDTVIDYPVLQPKIMTMIIIFIIICKKIFFRRMYIQQKGQCYGF